MDDPFTALKENLERVFRFEPTRNGKYAYPEIQSLEQALTLYHPARNKTFTQLVGALCGALPHLEKWSINFDILKVSLDSLATQHNMPEARWDRLTLPPKTSFRLQFNQKKKSQHELIAWLNSISGETFESYNPQEQTHILLTYMKHFGFSHKLIAHLKKDPLFLFQLIMACKENFIKIAHSRLILYLTDPQIAEALIKYLPNFIKEETQLSFLQVEQGVQWVNNLLSNGRALSTLLRDAKAKIILEQSPLFCMYQTEEYHIHKKHLVDEKSLHP